MTTSASTVERGLAARARACDAASDEGLLDHPYPLDATAAEEVNPPRFIREAAKAALDRGETHYTARHGIAPLRTKLAERATREGFPVGPEETIVTNGAAEALYVVLQTALRPGNTVFLVGPVSPQVVALATFLQLRVERLRLDQAERFASGWDASPSLLLVAAPSAVTGQMPAAPQLRTLIDRALDAGATVVVDRSRAWCLYRDAGYGFDPSLGGRCITIGSFSTAFSMPGWRVGYVTAPGHQVSAPLELKQAMSICTSPIAQFAALAALEVADVWLAERRSFFAARRDALLRAGVPLAPADAWPVQLIDARPFGDDDIALAAHVAQARNVRVEPPSRYGAELRGYLRIDLRAPQQALDAVAEFFGALAT